MARATAAERELAAHRVDVHLLNRNGDIVASHRMQSWDVSMSAGEIAGAFRDSHGYTPSVRVRFMDGRNGDYLLPRSWRDS